MGRAFAATDPAHGAEEGVESVVLVVEDDPTVAASVQALLCSAGYTSAAYSSARELLSAMLPNVVRCLVIDVRLPRCSGLDLGWDTIHILLLPVVPSLIAALCVWRVRPPEERRKQSQSTAPIIHARTDSR